MKLKLEALIRKLHPDINYTVFLTLHGMDFFPPRELSKDELKNYLDYEVAFIEPDFTITIRSDKLF